MLNDCGKDSHGMERVLDPYVQNIADEFSGYMEDGKPVNRPALFAEMEQEVARRRAKEARAGLRRKVRNVAAALLLVCTVSMGGLVAVGAIELPFVDWFVRVFSDRNRTNSADLAYLREQGIEYAPMWLPDGYSIDGATSRDVLLDYSRITFSDEQGNMGYLDHIDGGLPVSYDVEHDGAPVTVGAHTGYWLRIEDVQMLIWQMDNDFFVLSVLADVDALQIAESVERIS